MIKLTPYPVVRQYDQADCGPAALLSVLRYWGGNTSIAHVRELARTDARGSTMLGLVQAAQALGFQAHGAKGTYEDLLRDVELPCIAHVIQDGLQHFVVVYKADGRGVLIGDPARGRLRLTRAQFEAMWKSGAAVLLKPGPELLRRDTPHWLRWVAEYLRHEQTWLIQAVFIGAVYTAIGLLTALFIQSLVDHHIPNGDLRRILILGGVLLGLQFVRAAAGYYRQRFLVELNQRVGVRMGTDFLTRIFRLPLGFFESRKVGDITARLNDAVKIQAAIMVLIGTTAIDVLIVTGSLIFVFMLARPLGWIAIVVVPAYTLILFTVARRLKREQHTALSQRAQLEASYIDSLSGISEILGYHASGHFTRTNLQFYRNYLDASKQLGLTEAAVTFRGELAGGIIIVVTLVVGAVLVVRSSLMLGQLMAGYSLVVSMLPAIAQVLQANIALQGASVAAARLFDLLLAEPEANRGRQPFRLRHGITVHNGRFVWPRGEVVFDGLDLSLRPGLVYGLWGPSGSGKSTLVKLLERKYEWTGGEMRVDDVDAAEIELADYRRAIAVVPESVHIFTGTLLENILLGRPLERPETLQDKIREFGLEPFLERFPHGLLTLVGARGWQLSAGERQIVGLLRAIVDEPEVLILDEGLNAVDVQRLEAILDTVRWYARTHVVLLISHQLDTLHWCDQLYVLESGRLITYDAPAAALEVHAIRPGAVRAEG